MAAPPSKLRWRLLPPSPAPAEPAPRPAATPAPNAKAPQPAPHQAAAPTAIPLPASASWHYRLRWQGEDGEAWLHWEQDGERYRLRLERQSGERRLPTWHSEGLLDARGGLRPQRFSTQNARGERRLPLPEAQVQDRLSWMLQAAALAADRGLRPGQRLQLQVAGWRGGVQHWELLAERDEQAPQLLRLRRLPPAGGALEQLLWLDPAQQYRPVRLRLRYDEAERWELIAR